MQDLIPLKDNFIKELELASIGEESSLPYIRVNLPKNNVEIPDTYQVIVIGGTNFSSAMVSRKDFKIDIFDIKKEKFEKFENGKDLCEFVYTHISQDVNTVCMNFAFPLDPVLRDGRIDGSLIDTPKDHNLADLIGKNIGKGIERYIYEKSGRRVSLSVANDTICLLLSGLSVSEKKNIACVILGTGFNLGIFHDDLTAVNIEAANFNKFEPSKEVLEIDKNTLSPGKHLFEKEIAGEYLYKHFNYILGSKNIDFRPISSTRELFAIAFGDSDNEEIIKIAKSLFEHSAKYLAASICAVAEFKDNDIDVIIQGGMFTEFYKEMLLDAINKLTNNRITIYKIDDSSRIGAALLI